MKILHLLYESKGDYFGMGGVGTRAYKIYEYLKDRHDVTLLCKKYPGAQDGEIGGLKHVFAGTESKSLTKTLLLYAYKSARFVKKYGKDYDIIVEEFSPAIPTFLHTFKKKPLILQVQGYTGRLYFRKYNPVYALFLHSMEHFRPRFYKNFIFVSSATAKKLLSKTISPSPSSPPVKGGELYLSTPPSREGLHSQDPLPSQKGTHSERPLPSQKGTHSERPLPSRERVRVRGNIAVIPNGISPELLETSSEDGNYILYIGRIDIYGKGLDILLKAYAEFHKSFPDIRLIITGDGRDREMFQAELTRLHNDVRKNVELQGWVSGNSKIEIIKNALFCIFPSRHEVQPISVLEAMACGKAVVVSELPELRYVIINRAGLSFRTGDALTLTQSMKELMTNIERKEMGERGRDWVKEFTWEKIAEQYEQFLYKVLDKSGRKSV
ncbi:MAG: glycosyltransferase family 4 protein [Nitrospirota bacterium]